MVLYILHTDIYTFFFVNDFLIVLKIKSQPLCCPPKAIRITNTFREFVSDSTIPFHTLSLLQLVECHFIKISI